MGKIAFLFPGQGAQYTGMGKSLYETEPEVKALFDEAEKIRPGTLNQMFEGTKEELTLTLNSQPCLYLADLAAAIAVKNHGISPDACAGFSLGEIAALAFGKAYTYNDGFRLVCKRADLMNQAGSKADSGMTAVLKLDDEAVENACKKFLEVYPVNYNSDGQLVVAGKKESLPEFKEEIASIGGRTIDLAVSGGFHSPFMDSASEGFSKVLESFDIKLPDIKVYANYDASLYTKNPKEVLPQQINNPVRWKNIIKDMSSNGFDTFIEVGPGKVLSGLVKKIVPGAKIYAADSAETVEALVKAVSENV